MSDSGVLFAQSGSFMHVPLKYYEPRPWRGFLFLYDLENHLDYREKALDALAAVIISAGTVQIYFWLKNGGVSKLPFVKKWLGEKIMNHDFQTVIYRHD
ncbi:hypothetical protein SD961_18060 [Erwinia sp. MMLR14_017]|uniref:hypothetical protein n=1 Tax=Erwinia sp. MMLR14_017 TaxID=3093842 RepID=UPI00298F7D08|nr:hypothetical protein [Erwinia sp. MMLR14_017]MDW8847764.1 hypothetical protein [Erwinia sp. MMLR14_017]